ncbi:MAG: hypothetical protein WBD95_04640 [Xanthobacteraceae bacterium]
MSIRQTLGLVAVFLATSVGILGMAVAADTTRQSFVVAQQPSNPPLSLDPPTAVGPRPGYAPRIVPPATYTPQAQRGYVPQITPQPTYAPQPFAAYTAQPYPPPVVQAPAASAGATGFRGFLDGFFNSDPDDERELCHLPTGPCDNDHRVSN